jgi:hypothetical protein
MSDDFWSSIGFHLKDLVAGVAGGAARSFLFRKFKPWAIIGSVVVGGISANYLASVVSNFLGTPLLPSAFIVGLAGMELCGRIIESAGSWNPIRGQKE